MMLDALKMIRANLQRVFKGQTQFSHSTTRGREPAGLGAMPGDARLRGAGLRRATWASAAKTSLSGRWKALKSFGPPERRAPCPSLATFGARAPTWPCSTRRGELRSFEAGQKKAPRCRACNRERRKRPLAFVLLGFWTYALFCSDGFRWAGLR